MTKSLTLHEITGSPNNVKVRIALGIKGLDYERVPLAIDTFPGDRSLPLAISGQPRLPVLKHGETVIFDSRGILRYLDANFRDTHPLYSEDYEAMGEIEGWELFSMTALSGPVSAMFGQVMSGSPDPKACAEASNMLNAQTDRIESALESRPYLMGDEIKAPDVVCAPSVILGMLPEAAAAAGPIHAAFQHFFKLGERRERTRDWARRVISHDPISREWF